MNVKIEKKILILSFAVGLAAALIVFLLYLFLVKPPADVTQVSKMDRVKVLIAGKDIPAGGTIKTNDVSYIEILSKTPPKGSFTDPLELSGKKPVRFIKAGEVINEGAFVGLYREEIPEGFVAVSLKVDSVSGVSGLIQPGDVVDVVGSYSSPGGKKVSNVILQAIKVIFVSEKEKGRDKTVTLLMELKDSQKLLLVYKAGDYTLALRGIKDKTFYPIKPVIVTELYGSAGKKAEGKPAVKVTSEITIVEVK